MRMTVASSIVACSTLRLFDCTGGPYLLPWEVYAIMLIGGIALAFWPLCRKSVS